MHVADLGRVLEAECPDTYPPLARIVHPDVPSTTAARPSGLSAIRDGLVRGELDPIERVRQCLARIESVAHLNAYRHVDADRAIAMAEALQRNVRAGEPVGPLAGSVVAVKDSFAVAGLPMHVGSKALPVQHPEQSALVVERLMRAGAIVIGTTNMHELGYGATNVNGHFGNVGHPLDPRLTPGGSSGGSAVAVATGTADFSLGTDAAGSVRMPAALCGIVGFKPTFDALSMAGMHQLSWSLDHVGILAKRALPTRSRFSRSCGARRVLPHLRSRTWRNPPSGFSSRRTTFSSTSVRMWFRHTGAPCKRFATPACWWKKASSMESTGHRAFSSSRCARKLRR